MEKLFRVSNSNKTTYKGVLQNILQVYSAISGKQTCDYHKTINEIRAIDDQDPKLRKKKRDPLKKNLPTVEFNSICKGIHKDKNVERVTGYIVMDIDHLDADKSVAETMAVQLRDNLFNNERLGVVLSFISPSGDGVKAVVSVPGVTTDTYSQWWDCVKYFIEKSYAIECDKSCKNISRLTYMSYDPDARISRDPNKAFDYTLEDYRHLVENGKTKTAPPTKTKYGGTSLHTCYDKLRLQRFFTDYAAFLAKHTPPVFSDYNSWIALGGHLYEIFEGSQQGLQIWEDISRYAPNYNPNDFKTNWKFRVTPKNNCDGALGLVYNQTSVHLNFKPWFLHETYICGL